VALELDEEVVLPALSWDGAGIHLGNVDILLFEHAQRITKTTRLPLVKGDHDQGLVLAGWLVALQANHKEPCCVDILILNISVNDDEII